MDSGFRVNASKTKIPMFSGNTSNMWFVHVIWYLVKIWDKRWFYIAEHTSECRKHGYNFYFKLNLNYHWRKEYTKDLPMSEAE